MMVAEEIVEQENAARALREAEAFKSPLIASGQDCIGILDLKGRVQWMNEGAMQVLGISDSGSFVNSSWIQLWQGEDVKSAQAAVEAAGKGVDCRFTGC